MLDVLFSPSSGGALTLPNTLLILVASIGYGLVISLVYMWTHKKEMYVPSFPVTLIMLPVIIAIIILLVGNNVARAFSLAGAFSLIRFRSAPGDPKDIAYVFFTLAVGLACGMGYIGYAGLFVVILCGVMIVLTLISFAVPKTSSMVLKITVPENLNYVGLFDDILAEHTTMFHLIKVKTVDFGALFEVVYQVILKNEAEQKTFLDALRCRNGNLKILLTLRGYEE